MATGTLRVYIAFASDPLDTAPTWTEVTDDVRMTSGYEVSTTRGRNSELEFDTSGSARFALSNRTRKYDPLNSSGTYYGQLTPGRQVKITATVNGTTYDVYRGFALGFAQRFATGGVDAWCEVECTDARGYLSLNKMTSDPYADYLGTVGTTTAFWRQSDGSNWYDAQSAGNTAARMTGEAIPTASLAAGMRGTALQSTGGVWRTYAASVTGYDTLSMWIQTTTVGSSSSVWRLLARGPVEWSTSVVGINSSGQVCAKSWDWNPGIFANMTGVRNVADGRPHHVVVVSTTIGSAIYIDGTLDAVSADGGGFMIAYLCGGDSAHLPFVGTIQDVALMSGGMTAAQVATLYGLGRGFLAESSTTRLGRLCDDANWPSAWRDFASLARAEVGAITYSGQAFNTAAAQVEASEQGRIFAAKDGTLTFLHRYAAQETTECATVQATFSDQGGAGDIPYASFGYDYDVLNVQNDITVTTPDGEGHASDTASIVQCGERSAVIDTILSSPKAALDMATGLVYQRKDPSARIPPMQVPFVACDNTAAAALLNLELQHRVAVEITPMQTGAALSFEQHVERISWTFGEVWECEVATSPVKPAFFMLGTDELDGGTPLGY